MSLSTPALAPRTLWPGLVTGLLWWAAAASAVFWWFQFPAGRSALAPSLVPVHALASPGHAAPLSSPLLRAWGVQGTMPEPAVAQSARYQLWGVVAGASGQGSALISIDGQPPKAYRVGQALSEGVVLQSLSHRQAQLGASVQGPGLFALTLPSRDKTP